MVSSIGDSIKASGASRISWGPQRQASLGWTLAYSGKESHDFGCDKSQQNISSAMIRLTETDSQSSTVALWNTNIAVKNRDDI